MSRARASIGSPQTCFNLELLASIINLLMAKFHGVIICCQSYNINITNIANIGPIVMLSILEFIDLTSQG